MKGPSVSGHAILRYLERTGAQEKYELKILKVVTEGMEVRPVNGFMKLLRNNMVDARYYHYNNLVAVVSEGNMVVTVMEYIKSKWGRK